MDPTQGSENFPGADVTPEEFELLKAMERYQRANRRRYPTWREVLLVIRCLGYRKVAAPTPLPDRPAHRRDDQPGVPP